MSSQERGHRDTDAGRRPCDSRSRDGGDAATSRRPPGWQQGPSPPPQGEWTSHTHPATADLQPPEGERKNSPGATEFVTPRVSHTCILCIFHLDPQFLIHSADAQRAPHTPSPPNLQQPPCTMPSKLAPGQGKPVANPGQTHCKPRANPLQGKPVQGSRDQVPAAEVARFPKDKLFLLVFM